MTNKEAISVLESISAKTDYFLINDDARAEAIDMAISALQAQDAPDINVGDTISKQAAINEVVAWMKDCMSDKKNGKPLTERLKDLPSVQSEIIHCKDCKNSEHWYRDRRRCFLWSEDGVSVFDDGFCNYAERKREET